MFAKVQAAVVRDGLGWSVEKMVVEAIQHVTEDEALALGVASASRREALRALMTSWMSVIPDEPLVRGSTMKAGAEDAPPSDGSATKPAAPAVLKVRVSEGRQVWNEFEIPAETYTDLATLCERTGLELGPALTEAVTEHLEHVEIEALNTAISHAERAALVKVATQHVDCIGIQDMELALNSAVALLDLVTWRYGYLMETYCGKRGGQAAAGAGALEGDIVRELLRCFDLAWKERREQRTQLIALHRLAGLPLDNDDQKHLEQMLYLMRPASAAPTPARETAPSASGEGKVAA